MAGHVANEDGGFVVRECGDAEKIAAHRFGGLVAMDKLERALFREYVAGENRVLLRQHGQLDFARHLQIALHELVFDV